MAAARALGRQDLSGSSTHGASYVTRATAPRRSIGHERVVARNAGLRVGRAHASPANERGCVATHAGDRAAVAIAQRGGPHALANAPCVGRAAGGHRRLAVCLGVDPIGGTHARTRRRIRLGAFVASAGRALDALVSLGSGASHGVCLAGAALRCGAGSGVSAGGARVAAYLEILLRTAVVVAELALVGSFLRSARVRIIDRTPRKLPRRTRFGRFTHEVTLREVRGPI